MKKFGITKLLAILFIMIAIVSAIYELSASWPEEKGYVVLYLIFIIAFVSMLFKLIFGK